eukprot:11628126-Alexandrium_andersonii.AAC.1
MCIRDSPEAPGEPAHAGAGPSHDSMSIAGESVRPEDVAEDVDEEMGHLEKHLGRPFGSTEERDEA